MLFSPQFLSLGPFQPPPSYDGKPRLSPTATTPSRTHLPPYPIPCFYTTEHAGFELQGLCLSLYGALAASASHGPRPASHEPLLLALARARAPYPAVLARPGTADTQDSKMASPGEYLYIKVTSLRAGYAVQGSGLRTALGGEGAAKPLPLHSGPSLRPYRRLTEPFAQGLTPFGPSLLSQPRRPPP